MKVFFDPILNKLRVRDTAGSVDPTIGLRITNLENNEYKITYYEIVPGTSGSLTIPTGATINENEFGASGNSILSKINGSNKPIFESPQTASGVTVTANLLANGSWTTSGTYTDSSVALIYSIRIKAIDLVNLNYDRIIESEENELKEIVYTTSLPIVGDSKMLYINTITGSASRWDGTTYILLYSRNHGALNLDDGTNPHGTTATDVGLGNVNNTADINKPVSTSQEEYIYSIVTIMGS